MKLEDLKVGDNFMTLATHAFGEVLEHFEAETDIEAARRGSSTGPILFDYAGSSGEAHVLVTLSYPDGRYTTRRLHPKIIVGNIDSVLLCSE